MADMLAPSAQVRQAFVPGACQLQSLLHQRAIQLQRSAQLNLHAELELGRRDGPAVQYPAAAPPQRRGQPGQQIVAVLIGECLDVEGEHGPVRSRGAYFAPLLCSSDGARLRVTAWR